MEVNITNSYLNNYDYKIDKKQFYSSIIKLLVLRLFVKEC